MGVIFLGVFWVRFVHDPIPPPPEIVGFRKLEKPLIDEQADFDCLKNRPEPYS